jgi:hypothetical protein
MLENIRHCESLLSGRVGWIQFYSALKGRQRRARTRQLTVTVKVLQTQPKTVIR